MKRVVYIILFILAFIVFKAFYLDEYLAKRAAENNVTEANNTMSEGSESTFSKPVPALKTSSVYSGEQNVSIKKQKLPYSDMPLEKLGNEIGDKIDGKL